MGYIGAGISKFNTADTLTVSGDANVTGTVNPTGDTAAGDDAAIGFTSTEGLILTGQGSTSDITVKNDADATVFTVPTGTDDILFPDDAKILVGAGSDLQIYHNGSNSFIDEAGTGDLYIRSNSGVNINKYTGETMLYAVPDGAVNLYYDNVVKFATTSAGVNATGKIGVNVAAPSADLQVETSANSPVLIKSTHANGGYIQYDLGASGANIGYVGSSNQLVNTGGTESLTDLAIRSQGNLVFSTGGSTERMRVEDGGAFLIGTTDSSPFNNTSTVGTSITGGELQLASVNSEAAYFNRSGSDGRVINIRRAGTFVGGIDVSTTQVTYNQTSDYRLKENVTYDWDATARLKQLKPARFNYIVAADNTVDGFLAHEVENVVPQAITGTKDAMMDEEYEVSAEERDADGKITKEAVKGTRSVIDPQCIDHSKLVPLLCKTILELEARITALEAAE